MSDPPILRQPPPAADEVGGRARVRLVGRCPLYPPWTKEQSETREPGGALVAELPNCCHLVIWPERAAGMGCRTGTLCRA